MSKELHGLVKGWESKVRKAQAAAKKKRAGSIFATMSVAHVDDDLDNPGEVYHAEKVFPTGDMYTGQWADNCPNGHGKHLWSDGCMYVGEWARGKTNGKGKFSWPSGATYEGQFKNGYMDGEGTFIGSSHYSYKGDWVYNLKHGKGIKKYENGDHYEGQWRRGRPDGQGRYQWSNGNHYIGQWRKGKMNGSGTMIWASGNRYDGCWEDGLPKGNGTYRWSDGSFYVGRWSLEPKEMSGTYYPSSSEEVGEFDWDPQEVYLSYLKDCIISETEEISVLPSDKMGNWPCEGELFQKQPTWKHSKSKDARQRRASDGRLSINGGSSLGSESDIDTTSVLSPGRETGEDFGSLRTDNGETTREIRHHGIRIQPTKKQGNTITKGHRNYELMLNLQLGIRCCSSLYSFLE